jgi:hypothetical protein
MPEFALDLFSDGPPDTGAQLCVRFKVERRRLIDDAVILPRLGGRLLGDGTQHVHGYPNSYTTLSRRAGSRGAVTGRDGPLRGRLARSSTSGRRQLAFSVHARIESSSTSAQVSWVIRSGGLSRSGILSVTTSPRSGPPAWCGAVEALAVEHGYEQQGHDGQCREALHGIETMKRVGSRAWLGRDSETTKPNRGRLVDVEVVGDDLHIQEPKDEQRESGHADECEHNQDEARESVGREVSRATWLPPALCGRFVGHPRG